MKNPKRAQEWAERLVDYTSSGLTMAAWCAANHFTIHQLKYWLRKSKSPSPQAAPSSDVWIPVAIQKELCPVPSAFLPVRVGQAVIEVHSGFQPELLRQVVQALEVPC